MYSILHETDEASSVNFCISGSFLPTKGRQIVTASAKCLKFYRLNSFTSADGRRRPSSSKIQLECLISYTLMAPIQGIAPIRLDEFPNSDSLILTFDDAKLSIVNINPTTMALHTISLHSIEDEFLRNGYLKDTHHPELRADPDNRCCAFTVYGRHLAVVPFQKNKIKRRKDEQHQILLHSYTIKLRSLDERLENVHDMCFLNGYYEPTLLFLYEPIQTTAGRASVRYDTVCILAVSLNSKDRSHAVVWNFSGLPMTVDRCLPILQPFGGVCLFGANEIIYLNQSAPSRGVSLNSCADDHSKFPLSGRYQNLRITLDGCSMQTLSMPNDICVVLRSGELYILSLETDQANVVRDLHLNKAFETSIPKTLLFCPPNYVFIGSRLGDSQLLQFYYDEQRDLSDFKNNALANNHSKILFDEYDIYLYGEEFCRSFFIEEKYAQVIRNYKFELIDSLPNIGPCKWLRTSGPSYISECFRNEPRDIYFDLVTASGHGKDSSLCFFHRTIRPQITTSTFLEDSQQIWTAGLRNDGTHKYLIISRERSSLALELAKDMVELDAPLFCQTESTIAVGDLANGSVVIQVTPTSIVLVADNRQLDVVAVDTNFPVISASIVDPFVVLLTLNGRFFFYQLLTSPQILLRSIPILELLKHDKSPITSLCLYKDVDGLIQYCTEESQHTNDDDDDVGEPTISSTMSTEKRVLSDKFSQYEPTVKKEEAMQIDHHRAAEGDDDDIDAFLYAPTDKGQNNQNPCKGSQTLTGINNEHEQEMEEGHTITGTTTIIPTFWLFIVRKNGNLYIYSVPEFRLVYMVRKFSQMHEVLYDDAQSAMDDEHNRPNHHGFMNTPVILPQPVESRSIDTPIGVKPEEIVVELQMCGMGLNKGRPVLSALIDDMVIFYELFTFDEKITGHVAVRFRRLPCTVVVRENRFLGPNGRAPVEMAREADDRHRQCIYPFRKIGHLSNGIFIAGGYPSMLLINRGEPRLHPMTIDGQIHSFSQFNNSNCKDGFLYLTKKPEHLMRIAAINSDIIYDFSYPFRKIPIGKTIHQLVYLFQPGLICLVVSEKKANKTVCTVVNEEKQVEVLERDDNFILPTIDAYTLKLFATEDWNFVPNVDFELEEFEVATCCDEVLLSSESTVSGVKNYLALGTAANYGEEVYVRGRVLLFELIEVVPEEGMPTTRHRLKTIYDKEQKAPVTSLCAVNGFLLTGMGQKIFIWQFRDNQLHGISFLDLHFYVHQMVSFREFVLACDLYRSLSLIRYQESFKALSLVSRDLRPTAPAPMTSHFLVDHKHLGFILTDELANLTIFNYQPEIKESIGGERLIIRAALNIGSLINSFVRVKGHISDCFIDAEHQQCAHSCLFATLDGSFGYVRPVAEKIFRRLHMLQQVINMYVAQPAGLNPRGSRAACPHKTGTQQQISAAKNIVDGLLVFQYLHLSTQEKTDLARKLGTSRYQILDDITELSRAATHY